MLHETENTLETQIAEYKFLAWVILLLKIDDMTFEE